MGTSEKARKQDKGINSRFKSKVLEVGSADDDESDFECYDKSGGKPVYVKVDEDFTGGTGKDLKVALPPGLPEKKETSNNIGATRVWDESRFGNTSYRRSDKKNSKHRSSISQFWISNNLRLYFQDQLEKGHR